MISWTSNDLHIMVSSFKYGVTALVRFSWCRPSWQLFVSIAIKNLNSLKMDINCTTEEIPNIIDDKEIEVLIITSTETLKRQKSKCGKHEVFNLVKDKIEENITRDIFDKTLDSLIESGSVSAALFQIEHVFLLKNIMQLKIQICKEISINLKKIWLNFLINWKNLFLLRVNHSKINY